MMTVGGAIRHNETCFLKIIINPMFRTKLNKVPKHENWYVLANPFLFVIFVVVKLVKANIVLKSNNSIVSVLTMQTLFLYPVEIPFI